MGATAGLTNFDLLFKAAMTEARKPKGDPEGGEWTKGGGQVHGIYDVVAKASSTPSKDVLRSGYRHLSLSKPVEAVSGGAQTSDGYGVHEAKSDHSKAFAKGMNDAWKAGATDAEFMSLMKNYKSAKWYAAMNQALRAGDTTSEAGAKAHRLKELFEAHSTEVPAGSILYRTVNVGLGKTGGMYDMTPEEHEQKMSGANEGWKKAEGAVIANPGFISTSWGHKPIFHPDSDTVFRLHVTPGVRGMAARKNITMDDEQEVVLEPGTRFVVVKTGDVRTEAADAKGRSYRAAGVTDVLVYPPERET